MWGPIWKNCKVLKRNIKDNSNKFNASWWADSIQKWMPFIPQLTSRFMMCVCADLLQSCPSLCEPMDCSPSGFSVHGDSPAKNTEMDCHALLQGIFLTPGLNTHLLCFVGSLPLAPPGKPRFIIFPVKLSMGYFMCVCTNVCVWWWWFSC